MKVTAFCGSARMDGNTSILVNYVLAELEKEGISTELVQLAAGKSKGVRRVTNVLSTRTNDAQ